jgi:KDO2-lipid IV(A) lauroyltransferase
MILPNLMSKAKNKFSPSLLSLKSIITWIGMGLLRIISLLPYEILMRLGDSLGLLIYKLSPHRKEISTININRCLQKEGDELNQFVKSNFQAVGRGIFEMAIGWWASDQRILNIKTRLINGHLLENRAEGALLLIKHSTHLELDLRLLSQFFTLTGMYKSQSNAVLNYVMIKARNNYIDASLTNKEGLKAARWIKSGKIFLYAADQDYGQNVSEMVPFFGHQAATVTFPELFCKKSTKIIFADVSNVKGTYEIELKELHSSQNRYDFLKGMNDLYQEFILKEPEGYLWMHRRFKSGLHENIYPKWSSRDKKREKRRLKR